MPDTFDTRAQDAMQVHHRTRRLLTRYNQSPSDAPDLRAALLDDLLGHRGAGVWIEPPFFCDNGRNIHLGKGVFLNFNCVILDGARVEIGSGTLLGPAVQIYATSHPLPSTERMYEKDGIPAYRTTAAPITIGQNTWIGGGAILLPGIRIGNNTTIGAGSVVTSSIPANVFAAGNPCKIIRQL